MITPYHTKSEYGKMNEVMFDPFVIGPLAIGILIMVGVVSYIAVRLFRFYMVSRELLPSRRMQRLREETMETRWPAGKQSHERLAERASGHKAGHLTVSGGTRSAGSYDRRAWETAQDPLRDWPIPEKAGLEADYWSANTGTEDRAKGNPLDEAFEDVSEADWRALSGSRRDQTASPECEDQVR